MKIDRAGVAAKAIVTLEREEADTSYMSAGFDETTLKWIAGELNRGNEWAWCDVKVTGRLFGCEAISYLGQCSYESRNNFIQCDYYKSLVDEVIDELVQQLQSIADDHTIWEHDRIQCLVCASTQE